MLNFKPQLDLLTFVHHKRLLSFVGYCDEDGVKSLIYEYMAKWNLQQLLSAKLMLDMVRYQEVWAFRMKAVYCGLVVGIYSKTDCRLDLLTFVHHKRLLSFVGYCDEDGVKSLIYEYMAKWNLQQLLSGRLCFTFPKEMEQFVERKILLKIELNRYNNDHPNSSVSVATYVECVDLNDDFNEVASVVQVGGPSALAIEENKDIVYVKNATVEAIVRGYRDYCHACSQLLYVELEEVSISHKKPVGENSKSESVVPSSPSKTYAKPNKSIKKEKM
ncbi:hypothetical protein K1719_034270 [Acacia pycnantha]|nr:hypothetical protein K1719_034270 [Acacia pycnantha]